MILSEVDVLQKLDRSLQEDTDSWPEFALKEVTVVEQRTGKAISLLEAHAGRLLRVNGMLQEIDRSLQGLVKIGPQYRKKPIAISDVSIYSFSQYEDGTFGFWAAGRAGWFEIRSPAPSYQDIYRDMEEATGMFYYLADKYRNARTTFSKEATKVVDSYVRRMFGDYFHHDACRREDAPDAREGFYQHRQFLIKSMLEGQEGLEWELSPVLRHLKKLYPEEYRSMKLTVLGKHGLGHVEHGADVGIKGGNDIDDGRKKQRAKRATSTSEKQQAVPRTIDLEEDNSDIDMEDVEDAALVSDGKHKRKSVLRLVGDKGPKKAATRRENLRSSRRLSAAARAEATTEDEVRPVKRPSPPLLSSITVAKLRYFDTATHDALPCYYEAKGPENTWTCPYDDCNRQIWDAKSPESVEMIKQHFASMHAETMEELIISEERPWARVGHLLERARAMAAIKANGSLKNGFPSPIVRRY